MDYFELREQLGITHLPDLLAPYYQPRPAAPRHPGGRIAQHRVRSRNVDVPACCEEELGLLVALA